MSCPKPTAVRIDGLQPGQEPRLVVEYDDGTQRVFDNAYSDETERELGRILGAPTDFTPGLIGERG